MNKLKVFIYILLLVVVTAVGVFVYWMYQPTEVVKFNKPITVVPPTAPTGTAVFLNLNYCKKQSVTGLVRASFLSNSTEIFQPQSVDTQKARCYNVNLPVLVPQIAPGKYRIKFKATYQLNPLKTEIEEFTTEEFTIAGDGTNQGSQGVQGIQGIQGVQGEQGIPGK